MLFAIIGEHTDVFESLPEIPGFCPVQWGNIVDSRLSTHANITLVNASKVKLCP